MFVNTSTQNFVAKRMSWSAVVGAAPKENVVREKPEAGDVVILLGGKMDVTVSVVRQVLLKFKRLNLLKQLVLKFKGMPSKNVRFPTSFRRGSDPSDQEIK